MAALLPTFGLIVKSLKAIPLRGQRSARGHLMHVDISSMLQLCLIRLKMMSQFCSASDVDSFVVGHGVLSISLTQEVGNLANLEQVMSVPKPLVTLSTNSSLFLEGRLKRRKNFSRAAEQSFFIVDGIIAQLSESTHLHNEMMIDKDLCLKASGNAAYNIKMNRNRSKKGRASQIPLFISKLLQMVENNEIAQVISWTSSGDCFNIKNITKFTEEVLPRYFKHRNFSSFIRQLNMYGFRKIRHADGQNVYMNEYFKMGGKQLLKNINRKIRQEREERVSVYQGAVVKHEGVPARQIQDLKVKQKNLEEMCRHFVMQNQKLLQENQKLVKKMEQQSRQKEKRLEDFLILLLAQKNSKALMSSETEPLLSIANQAYKPTAGRSQPDVTPLDILANTIDQNEHMQRVRSLFDGIYGKRSPMKRKQNSTTHHQMEDYPQVHHDPQDPHFRNQGGIELDKQDSFLSINDFLNADDYDNEIHLEESR